MFSNPLEAVAVAFGLVSVWLSAREHIVAWPTALVNTALYAIIFWHSGLYANAGLQVFFFALSCYGWWAWLYGGAARTALVVTRTTRRLWTILVPIAVALGALLGVGLSLIADAKLPWLDAPTTAASLVAQWMMTRKLLENWLIWIVLDVIYVGMYVSQGLLLTGLLYAVYIGIATLGYVSWRRSALS